MVERDLKARGIHDPATLRALSVVPRHLFVPSALKKYAYRDSALPIQEDQTISQPYVVALMTQSARLQEGDRVLEIGSGSGYQAAVLSEIAAEVFTIEIIENLADNARQRLQSLGYDNVRVRHGDGYQGWPERAPYDAILITAATPQIPQPLMEQLRVGGRLVVPLDRGGEFQELSVLVRTKDGYDIEPGIPVRFVPMTGQVREPGKLRTEP